MFFCGIHLFQISVERSYCDSADFYDNYNGFVLVARKVDGHIESVGDYRPQWITQLLLAAN